MKHISFSAIGHPCRYFALSSEQRGSLYWMGVPLDYGDTSHFLFVSFLSSFIVFVYWMGNPLDNGDTSLFGTLEFWLQRVTWNPSCVQRKSFLLTKCINTCVASSNSKYLVNVNSQCVIFVKMHQSSSALSDADINLRWWFAINFIHICTCYKHHTEWTTNNDYSGAPALLHICVKKDIQDAM